MKRLLNHSNHNSLQLNGDRVYAIRLEDGINKKVTIKKDFVDTFLEWNRMKIDIKTCKYDVKFIRLLSLLVVGWANLVRGEINPPAKEFIKSIYAARGGNNLLRLLQLDKIIDEYVKESKDKANKMKNAS